jgi:hypothetical protein
MLIQTKISSFLIEKVKKDHTKMALAAREAKFLEVFLCVLKR